VAAKPWKTLSMLVGALVAVGVLSAGLLLPYVGGLGMAAGSVTGKFLNTTCTLQESKPPQKTTLYARDGKTVIATLFSQDRVPVPLSDVPQILQEALIATEDRRFYQHHGVDLRGLIRSAISTSSGATQGGSTLTMQYVKQVRYYQAGNDVAKQQAAIDQNLQRKIEDAKCALYIENTLHESKGTILDNYLNIAFFGEHAYGIQTAAETYFDVPASKLTLEQSALLVGLLRAPSAYDPYVNRAAAKQRRDEVLQNLVSVGKLSQSAADQAKAQPVALATKSPPVVRQGCANSNSTIKNAAFFCEYTQNWLETVGGIKSTDLETGGLKIVTTLDPTLQNSAQARISEAVPASSPMTAVLPVVDPRTGDILAMATSKSYGTKTRGETEQPVFTAYTAQGASTFKLFPLLTALETGVPEQWPLDTVGNYGAYKTTNCATASTHVTNGDANVVYNPLETLASATAKSSNTYFVALADKLLNCNLDPIVTLMQKLGMNSLQTHDPADNPKFTIAQNVVNNQRAQQLVLGSIPTSPLELTGAYAAVANGGKYNAPAPVLSIRDSNGNSVPVNRKAGVQVLAPQVAAQAAQILTGDTTSVGTSASAFQSWYAENPSVIAGKTGTNESTKPNENSSVWFVGMTPDLVAASGLINFDHSSAPSSGLPGVGTGQAYGDYASEVWLKALKPTLVNRSWTWEDPATVHGVDVPNIAGLSPADARRQLASANFKMQYIDANDPNLECPSSQTLGTIGYYGPQRATPGSTVTVCLSNGIAAYVPPPPVVYQPPPRHTPPPGGGGGGGGGGGASSSPAGGGGGGGGSTKSHGPGNH
jgi:membrane peptidoglycan carboxypeptidase